MEGEAARLHMLHRAWRMLPQGARRSALLQASAWLAPRPDRPAPVARGGIAVGGELDRPSGLGEGARLTLRALEALGIPSWPVRPGGAVPPAGAPLILHGNASSLPMMLVRLGRERVRGRRVIGYWSWELPVAPDSWRPGMEFVHEVWAPSHFTAAAFASLTAAVRVVPHPVAVRPPAPSGLRRADFGLPADAFVTLVMFSLASSFERKNPLGAIAAHRAAFGGRSDRILFMHVTNPHHFPADFARLRAEAERTANVRLHTGDLSRADAEALMLCCDVLLSLHRSEGFGLVPAEAMMLGKPVVATDWSATTEYMDADSAALVPARLVPARDPRGVYEAPGAVWAEPDLQAASSWLQRLAGDVELRERLGAAGRRAAQARLGPEKLADAVAALGLRH
jgi:glycosyltransferase involved in cell wall biosynthesis